MSYHQIVPFGPLERFCRRVYGFDSPTIDAREAGDWTMNDGAVACGVGLATMQKWKQMGLSVGQAEKAAKGLGVHPMFVWGLADYERLWAEDEARRLRVCDGCGAEFFAADIRAVNRFCNELTCEDPHSRFRARRRLAARNPALPLLVDIPA